MHVLIPHSHVYSCRSMSPKLDNSLRFTMAGSASYPLTQQNTRIQSHSFICEKVKIGNNCFIGHGVNFVNDKFLHNKTIKDKEQFLKTKIGNSVLIGSNSTILPINIEDNVVIGAGSVVTKNCTKKGLYFGNPAKLKK